jgi:hypothetical protein
MSETNNAQLKFSLEYFTSENLFNDFIEIFEATGSTQTRIYEDQLRHGYLNAGGNIGEWYPKINPVIQAAKKRAETCCTERGSILEAEFQKPSLHNGLTTIDATILHTPSPVHVIEQWIPENEVTLLGAHGGSGKSYVATKIGVHVALGLDLSGLGIQQGKVLFLSGEDSADILRYRVGRICESMKIEPITLKENLILLDASDVDAVLFDPESGGETDSLRWIGEFVERQNIKLVILDNASDLFGGDEIRRKEVRAFIRSLRTKLARPGRAVLLLVHINKTSAASGRNANSEDYSGSTAWHNSARSRLSLIPGKSGRFTIHHQKANHGPLSEPMVFDWIGGVPVDSAQAEHSPEKLAREANLQSQQKERDKADKSALLGLLRDFNLRGEHVTTSTHGPITVYKLLSQHNAYPKMVDRQRLTQLLRDLETEGRIRRSEVRTLGRKWREVFSLLGDPAPNQSQELPSQVEEQEYQ